MEIRRRINAWILLGLFIPLMMTASLHRHEVVGEQEELCESCIHHQAHSGHLASGVSCIVECVFCQFLTYHFLKASVCSVVAFIALVFMVRPMAKCLYAFSPIQYHSSRAPPYIL